MLSATHLEFRDGRPTGKVSVDSDALLDVLRSAYSVLNGHEFPGRATIEGQALLCSLRDSIGEVSGETGQSVQDKAANAPDWFRHAKTQPGERKRAAADKLFTACERVETLIDSDLHVGMAYRASKEQALRQVREALRDAKEGPRV